MKITKFFAAALMICALAMPAMAQDDSHDPKAKVVLEKVATTTQGYDNLRASFEWTLENKAAKTKDTKNGHMFLKGEKYKMMLGDMELISDGTTVWTYSKSDKEVTISEIEEGDENVISNPAKIFSLYEKGFKYAMKDEKSVDVKVKKDGKVTTVKKNCYIVDLYPESPKGKEFHTVELIIDKAENQIQSIEIKFKNGSSQIIEIVEYKSNTVMPESMFSFDPAKFPGVEVNDMR